MTTSVFIFSGCSLAAKIVGKTYVSYPQASRFLVGETELDSAFEDLLIDWYGGSVYISEYDGDEVLLKETANKELSQDMQVHWAYFQSSDYGDYYSIKYCKKGMWDLSDLKKDLVILIPSNYTTFNKLSITARGECDINIYLPNVSFVGDVYGGDYNVHLDAEYGDINAMFKDVDSLRMIGDGEEKANSRNRVVIAQKVGGIDYVSSFSRVIINVASLTNYADIKNFAGDITFSCHESLRKLTTVTTKGTTYIRAKSFDKLDLTTREGLIGVETSYDQKFKVTMSNYTLYKNNDKYKEPHFIGGLPIDVETNEEQITHSGDTWTVGTGKNKYGKDIDVKVMSGADVYFGTPQSFNFEEFEKTGVFDNTPDPVISYEDWQRQTNNQQN